MLSIPRRVLGTLLLAAVPFLAAAAGLTSFFAAAAVTSSVPALSVTGLLATASVATAAGLAGWRLLRRPQRTAGFAAVVTVVCATLTGSAVLVPGPRPAAGTAPSWVQFWNLPTGSRIAYAHRPATGPRRPFPVVFLHGGPGTPGNGLPPVSHALAAAGFDVYAYDQLGAGRSSRLSDVTGYTVARQVADLESIRALLHVDKLILVGQSWGGSLAALYLAAHPARVDRVAFTSPGPLWPAAWPDGGTGDPWARLSPAQHRRRDEVINRPRVYAAAILQSINANAAHNLVGDDEADHLLHRIAVIGKDATSCPGGPPVPIHDNHQGYYVNQMTNADFGRIPDPRPALRRTAVPALVLRGSCDFVPWPVTREYRETLSGAVMRCVPQAGHGIATDQPGTYARTIEEFVRGTTVTSTCDRPD